jgi:hypothetical protein
VLAAADLMKRIALALGTPMMLIVAARPALAVQNAPALGSLAPTETPWWHYAVPAGIVALALLVAARMVVRELRRTRRAGDATLELASQLVSMSDAMVGLAARGGRLPHAEHNNVPPLAPVVPAVAVPVPERAADVAAAPVPATPQETAHFAAMQRVMELDHERRRLQSELEWPSDAEIERFRAAHHAAEFPNS